MHFSTQYAILFALAGFAAAAYFLRVGSSAKKVPILALAVCSIYTLANHGLSYAMLTAIEFAVGFGVAHAVVKSDAGPSKRDNQGL